MSHCDLNLVLLEPEIPQNTGNIARTCAATGASLHLIKPLGFAVTDKYLKRAGMDYWNAVTVNYYENFEHFLAKNQNGQKIFITTKAPKTYSDFPYSEHVYLIFGKESKGIPEPLLKENKEFCVRIPMVAAARSLNLSNAAAILAYEVLRQQGFPDLMPTSKGLFNI